MNYKVMFGLQVYVSSIRNIAKHCGFVVCNTDKEIINSCEILIRVDEGSKPDSERFNVALASLGFSVVWFTYSDGWVLQVRGYVSNY